MRPDGSQHMVNVEFETSELEFCQHIIGRLWRFVKYRMTGFPVLCFRKKLV